MQDLRTANLPKVIDKAGTIEITTVLKWLADFHAFWMGSRSEGLWEIGTYWHLATRSDELDALQDERLKRAASKIDDMLNECPFQTLVHGDAKLANFCFSEDGKQTAAVDFQYVGRGVGVKDVMLFLTSVISFKENESQIDYHLEVYFDALAASLSRYHPDIHVEDVEQAWRPLFGLAWADFQRFMKGWCPTHFKVNSFTEAIVDKALRDIGL
jgi:thiamine kinase-like enzyme